MRWIAMALVMLSVPIADSVAADAQAGPPVRLVLQITVDGLRADLLNRYADGFGEGGFRYLLDKGTVYTNAHYQHANTETIVGHTTLATGAYPSVHGMVGNVWFDRETGELAYNIEDPDSPIIAVREGLQKGAQVDPAQKLSRTQGRSPVSILAPTFSDTLAAYYGGRSKVFGVSGKDRGAVSMAGHTGKAFWYSTDSGDFVTSTYYYDEYPDWARKWNAQRKADQYAGTEWSLLHDAARYSLRHQDDRPYEVDLKGFGRVFPHPFGSAEDKLFYTRVLVSPAGDRLALDFSKTLIANEGLGKDEIPDYLSVSFSSVDAVNHFFGPSSLENEDVVLRLDRTLAELLAFVDGRIGLEKVLVVLSADHGMAEMPEYMSELGYAAGRLYTEDVVAAADEIGERLFGVNDVTNMFFRPYLYLDRQKIAAAGLDHVDVEAAIAAALSEKAGIGVAVSMSNFSEALTTPAIQRIKHNFHPSRSGDIYVAQAPYWFMFSKGPVAAMHGSPWRYDTHVPIIFAGAGLQANLVHRLVHPVDVAPTMAVFLGMTGPGSAVGNVLVEVVQ
jgi:predicted AlkP superfamily pyrophosphatase or phosphodiesterase